VLPDGRIVALPHRGTMMGNRGGRIHNDRWQITRRQASRHWIICETVWKDFWRPVMGDGYTELFFLDEATALAAGHRPCCYCRRRAALDFVQAAGHARADAVDRVLAVQRQAPRPPCNPDNLPFGAMVAADGAFLLRAGVWLEWTPARYRPAAAPAEAVLLTPQLTCDALRNGFRPRLHPSALAAH
jgi:hypothetical protein